MSKLDELITELCPDGVGYKSLGEVSNYSSSKIDATNVDASSYVGVDNLLPDKKGKIDSSYVPTEGRMTQFAEGDILIGNIRPYLKKIWLATHEGGTNGDVLVIQIKDRKKLSSEYLFYALSSDQFFIYDVQNSKGAKMPRGDKAAVMKYRIPLPPLPVQHEIVRILDNFTKLTAKLTAELTAELTARKKQYEYYRNRLLTFEDDVPTGTLGEISIKTYSGGTPLANKAEYYGGDIPWLRTQEVRFGYIYDTEMRITPAALKNSAAKWIPANCVIIAISGATAGRSAINKIPLTTNQHCCCLEINPKTANYRYVFHWVSSQYQNLKSFGQGARSDLNSGIIKGYPIPLPSLEEQERIVAILDRFDALCNDLTSGLPAEIEARRKQYEYYRDKLLTFKEASA